MKSWLADNGRSSPAITLAPDAALVDFDRGIEHSWAWDEDTNGHSYRFCMRCSRDEGACQPNEFHGYIACTIRT